MVHYIPSVIKETIHSALAGMGYQLKPIQPKADPAPGVSVTPCLAVVAEFDPWTHSKESYTENSEIGAVNMKFKLDNLKQGESFEWPDIVALNITVSRMIGDAKRIAELGGGTGCFAYEATKDDDVFVLSSELDAEASRWARENRSRPNIHYIQRPITESDGPFDLVVAIEVIEHVADYRGFLKTCSTLAARAIYTTPNKNRRPEDAAASPPLKAKHVREWTAGEFYWVLKTFYRSVKLFSMPDPYVPGCRLIHISEKLSPLIAVCENPI